jgi:hypothetical protein
MVLKEIGYSLKMCTAYICSEEDQLANLCEQGNEPSGFVKGWVFND